MAHLLLRRALPRTTNFTLQSRSSPIPQASTSPILRRSFHASSHRRLNVVEPIISGASSYLTALHLWLPWYAVLPLGAATVRFVLMPITLWSRELQRKQLSLFPLIHAWRHAMRRRIMRSATAGRMSPTVVQRTEMKLVRQKRKELYKQFGCQAWKNYLPVLPQFGLFLVMIESIRGLVGAKEGILRMAFGNDAAWLKAPEGLSQAGEKLEQAVVGLVDKIPLDPSLTTEGMLWFTDLTAPDPQLLLPFILSATIFANMIPKRSFNLTRAPSASPPGPKVELPLAQRVLRRLMMAFALAIGPLTLGMPSGLLLYWISSSSLGLLQSLGLDLLRPLPKSVSPCKPPVVSLAAQFKEKKTETPIRAHLMARLAEKTSRLEDKK